MQVNDNEHIVDDGATSFELHSCVSCRLYQFSLQVCNNMYLNSLKVWQWKGSALVYSKIVLTKSS